MADSIYKWSLTAASNDAADSIINWREGQLPDTVNDSARAVMKRVAEWREDLTGSLITTGTQPDYLVTANSGFDTLANGRGLVLRIHASNTGAAATLNVNGLGAKAIRKFGVNGDQPLNGGDLQLGGLYTFFYSSTANGGAGAWTVTNPASGGGFTSGTVLLFAMATAPVGWTKQTTHNDKALRVVSGGSGGSAGGNTAFSTVFSATRIVNGTVGNTTLTAAQMPSHAHTQQGSFNTGTVSADHYHYSSGSFNTGGESIDHQHYYTVYGGDGGRGEGAGSNGVPSVLGNFWTSGRNNGHYHGVSVSFNSGGISANHIHGVTISGDTTSAGSGQSHTHSFTGAATDFAVQYVDVIIASKD